MDESFEVSPVDESLIETDMNVCSVCLYKTRYRSNLTRHMKTHSDAAEPHPDETRGFHVCCQCGKKYMTKYGLTLHERSVHEQSFRFTCSVCQKGYNMLSAYKGHLSTHDKVLKSKCTHCSKSFCHTKTLKEHMQSAHSTEQFTCKEDGCGASFSSQKNLSEHHLGMHKSRVYTCNQCNKHFKWRSSAHAHQRNCQK